LAVAGYGNEAVKLHSISNSIQWPITAGYWLSA
jgi:hypothetical protein